MRWIGRLWRRWVGRSGLAVRRAVAHGTAVSPRRTAATVAGVAVAVAVVVVVSSLALGMTGATAGLGGSDTYWILPEAGGDRSPLVATDDPQFGDAHGALGLLEGSEAVDAATPMLVEILRVETAGGGSEYVAVVGIVPGEHAESPLGVSTAAFTPGSPHYADGTYEGTWTGEVVLSAGAAGLLEATVGEELVLVGHDEHPFHVADVDGGTAQGLFGTTPVAFVHLAELQTVVGAADADRADQFVVQTTDPDALEGLYEHADVLSSSELFVHQLAESNVAMALGMAGLAVGVLVGVLFLSTSMAMEVAADRTKLRSMAAIGVGRPARLWIVGGQALVLVAVGGVLGSGLGYAGVHVANATADALVSTGDIAVAHPVLLVYGVVVALGIGLVTLPVLGAVLVRLERPGGRVDA